jgi:spore coat protein U-like protein
MKLLLLSLLTFNCLAATTGTLFLKGNVPVNCGITVAPTAKATTLDLIAGEVGANVGSVTETCNNVNGYTISLSSANGGRLVNGSLNAPYTIKYDVDGYRSLGAAGVVRTVVNMTSKTVKVSPILVTIPANPNLVGGDYSDTVTITILSP